MEKFAAYKRLLAIGITLLLLTCGFSRLTAQTPFVAVYSEGRVGLYSDPQLMSTEALDTAVGTLTVYVVQEDSRDPGDVIQFQILGSPGFTGVWLNESSPFSTVIGTSPSGITIGYNACRFTPLLLLTVSYSLMGTSATCSFLEAGPHPDNPSGRIEYSTCYADVLGLEGGKLVINPDSSCANVPVDQSTWGRIKAQYQGN